MWWADTANDLLKQRNAANSAWITKGTLSAAYGGLPASSITYDPGSPNLLAATNVQDAIDELAVGASGSPCFRAHKNGTNQTGIASATETKITFGTEEFDVGGHYDAANSKFQPTVAGKYHLSTTLQVATANVLDQNGFFIRIFKNGASVAECVVIFSANATVHSNSVSTIVDANGSTDYFEVYVSILGAGDKTISGGTTQTWFCGERV